MTNPEHPYRDEQRKLITFNVEHLNLKTQRLLAYDTISTYDVTLDDVQPVYKTRGVRDMWYGYALLFANGSRTKILQFNRPNFHPETAVKMIGDELLESTK